MTRSKRTTDKATAELPETEQRSAKKQRRRVQQETDDDASMVETDTNGHSEEPNAAERNGSEESDSTETIEWCEFEQASQQFLSSNFCMMARLVFVALKRFDEADVFANPL